MTPNDTPAPRYSRRAFLTATGGLAVVGGGTYALHRRTAGSPSASSAAERTLASSGVAGPVDHRRLVVIELQGGNDGLATLIPVGDGHLHDRRRELLSFDESSPVEIDDRNVLHPALGDLAAHGLAVVQGLGVTDPNGSHFDMEQRWWSGDGADRSRTGFLGRLCDQLDVGDPFCGVSVGTNYSPALRSARATTLSIADPNVGWFLDEEDEWFRNLRAGLADIAPETTDDALFSAAGHGIRTALRVGEVGRSHSSNEADDNDDAYAYNDLSEPLQLAAALLDSDLGVRVCHVTLGGFDTHTGQRGTHDQLMATLNDALVSFRGDLAERGLADDTLVATTSEFGRRVAPSDSGTDHGAASVALLDGPVAAGLHGTPSSLSQLDENGNLVAEVDMVDYYASLAAWLGVDSGAVLDRPASAIDSLFV